VTALTATYLRHAIVRLALAEARRLMREQSLGLDEAVARAR
jgi:hypothetical protein